MNRLSIQRILSMSLILLAFWACAALLSLNVGSVHIPAGISFRILKAHLTGGAPAAVPLDSILLSVRLPRVFLGSLVGAALAAAGTAFQSLLRNPLADPYVLGVSTGASMGTILYSVILTSTGLSMSGSLLFGRPAAAFLGAALTVAAVYVVAGGGDRMGEGSQRLLLAGIVLASFISSINVFLLTSTNQADLRGIFYWLIGDLSRPVDASIYVVAAIVLAGCFALFLCSHSLNLISMGEVDAMVLGIEVRRVKVVVYVIASLITGAVVSVSGPIAYIGLICPHLARMMFGGDNRLLFPTVFVFGAIFTLLADTLARTVLSPAELPVGVITALCGAPLFVYLLRRRGGKP
ncbi:MAG TPA: iron ABC transporter permease [Acidobacteriota bacterium]|nr:iron ABC transporter permease [Acidobacteriota bacterium]